MTKPPKKDRKPSLPTPKTPARKRTPRQTLPNMLRQVADELEGLSAPVPVPAKPMTGEELAAVLSAPGRFRAAVMALRKAARRRKRLEDEDNEDEEGGDEGAAPPAAPKPKRRP